MVREEGVTIVCLPTDHFAQSNATTEMEGAPECWRFHMLHAKAALPA